MKTGFLREVLRVAGLLVVAAIALQAYFGARIALMSVLNPQSTTFQRSEAWRMLMERGRLEWSQEWVDYDAISPHLKRAVIASEDAGFTEHSGVEWDAIERAWERNLQAEAEAERLNEALLQRAAQRQDRSARPPSLKKHKLIGGSTITQQLAKNLFLSGERTAARKVQEIVISWMLEALLSKRRILEIYLNNVEWGEGVFGAEAAARRYFHTDASRLTVTASARLAVMLPAPKRFEKRPASAYVRGRAATIVGRMAAVQVP